MENQTNVLKEKDVVLTKNDLLNLTLGLDSYVDKIAQEFKGKKIPIVMSTVVPQRGISYLGNLARRGVETIIVGGDKDTIYENNVRQIGAGFNTSASKLNKETIQRITAKIPEEIERFALFYYCPHAYRWEKSIKEVFSKKPKKVVSSTCGGTRKFFENKSNLVRILREAGLNEHIIPSEMLDTSNLKTDTEKETKLRSLYEKYKNKKNSKIVIQCCDLSSVGGRETCIADNYQDFKKCINEEMPNNKIKISTFIDGAEGNLSFYASNILSQESGYGVKNLEIPEDCSEADIETIKKLASELGIDQSNIVTAVGSSTLKCVGDNLLTSSSTNGVGNIIGYQFSEKVRKQVYAIGEKLSYLMALCGKNGLGGADLIITKDEHVYINEVNDRQQGPSAQMSESAKNHGIPSLMDLSFISSFGDYSDEGLRKIMLSINKYRQKIYEGYANTDNQLKQNYYIKIHTLADTTVTNDFSTGKKNGKYIVVEPSEIKKLQWIKYNDATEEQKQKGITVCVEGGIIQKNQSLLKGAQIVRFSGNTNNTTLPPFYIDCRDGKSKLTKKWEGVIVSFVEQIFDKKYQNLCCQVLRKRKDFKDCGHSIL